MDAMTVPVPNRVFSISDYLAFEEQSERKHEFLDGRIVPMPGATGIHNLITVNITTALKIALRKLERKYLVMGSDMKIQIEAFNHFRYPDAVVVCEKLEYYRDRKDVIVNPLLIVEVLSEGTEKQDLGVKFDEYKTIPSFQEYLLVSQKRPYVSVYQREEQDLWRIKTILDPQAEIQLRSIGCTLSVTDIYEDISFEE